jgi:molybdate transport system substrate-binding protein
MTMPLDAAVALGHHPARKAGGMPVATIKVLSTGAVESMVRALGPAFEKKSGHTLDLAFNTAGGVRKRLAAGDAFDVIVLPTADIQAMAKEGKVVPGSVTDLGRTVTGVAVREGAPVPDISTPEAFKKALVAARGVSYSNPAAGGSSGTFFAALLQKLGIADEVNRKAVLGNRGYEVAQAVADGRVEIGTTFISELLTVKGVHIIGPLPGDLQNKGTYTAAIPVGSSVKDEASAFLHVLTDPATRGRWTAAGLEPAF